jgi:hypothetical protein
MRLLNLPYDELSQIVNSIYQQNYSIRQTMKETGLDFAEVFEICGYKDVRDWKE